MATLTLKLKERMSKTNVDEFIEVAFGKLSESISDMIVTIAVTAMTLTWLGLVGNPILVNLIAGYYIAAMLVALLIRIVQKFDDSYTTNELADRVIELEAKLNEKLDALKLNVEEGDLEFRKSLLEKVETIIRLDQSMRGQ